MGRRGPKPTPTPILKLRGNTKQVRQRAGEPQPRLGRPTCPAWLSAGGKKEWRRITQQLEELRLLAAIDRAALSAYCQSVAEMELSTAMLEKEGRVIEHRSYDKQGRVATSIQRAHPACALQAAAFRNIKQFLAEFGLSPSARTRINAPPPPADEGDPLDRLMAPPPGTNEEVG